MGVDRTDILQISDYDHAGAKKVRIHFLGLHFDADTANDRTTLRDASSGSDASFRSALVSVGGSPIGVAWDNAPTVDGWYASPTYSSRVRLRTLCGDLPT